MESLDWEMVAVIVTVVSGFLWMSFKIGKRDSTLDDVERQIKAVEENTKKHEAECEKLWKEQRDMNTKLEKYLYRDDARFHAIEDIQRRILDYLTGNNKK